MFLENGAPEKIRTPDPQIRSLVLYPAELRAQRLGSALCGYPQGGQGGWRLLKSCDIFKPDALTTFVNEP